MNKNNYNYHVTRFITSAINIHYLPEDIGFEIAFVGRSNAGKSSALNALTNQKNLARISKTPGRTQFFNLFEVTGNHRLIDLPGYGYAKAPEAIKYKWQQALNEYLQKRNCLKGLVMLVDIRHPLKELDKRMLMLATELNKPTLMLLTKADKLAFSTCKAKLYIMQKNVLPFINDIQIEIFSATQKIGVDKLKKNLIFGLMIARHQY
ncbi:putative GTPase, involved in coordination of cell cycle, engB family [Serratia symbiotica str. 'Cinara cedri']|nr:putative GTPase, involved in coordination of cell cycle, engB family [Serratia symbiotica str. 'Cinara cedri']